MGNFISSIIGVLWLAGGGSFLVYLVTGLFVKTPKIRIGIASPFFIIPALVTLFVPEYNKLGAILGIILTAYLEFKLISRGSSDEKK